MPSRRRRTPLVAVVGPTGTGKSDLAVALALEFDGEIINADSMQFYRGMDVGTAKLTTVERRGVPHHLLDVLDVREEASAADFQRQARDIVAAVVARGKVPILVGGSGLYIRAALDVLEFPGTDPAVRQRLETELEQQGFGALQARLLAVDPVSAGRIGDGKRLVRALEVHELSGRPFSSFMPAREYVRPTLQLGLDLERSVLRSRLADRVHRMVDAGLLDEVAALDMCGLREGKTASHALGYRQFLSVLDEDIGVEQATEETISATRQFARRQMTWFRADPRVTWLDPQRPDLLEAAAAAVQDGTAPGVGLKNDE